VQLEDTEQLRNFVQCMPCAADPSHHRIYDLHLYSRHFISECANPWN